MKLERVSKKEQDMIGQLHFYLMMNTLCSSLQQSAAERQSPNGDLPRAASLFQGILSQNISNTISLGSNSLKPLKLSSQADFNNPHPFLMGSSSVNALYTALQLLDQQHSPHRDDTANPSQTSNSRRSVSLADTEAGMKKNIDRVIEKASRTYDIDPALLRSVIQAESAFNPAATSSKGAMGLMQIMPETAEELGLKKPYDPEENIMAGTRYLRRLLDRYNGDREKALAAYNWGMGNVDKYGRSYPRETRIYISRIASYLKGNTVV